MARRYTGRMSGERYLANASPSKMEVHDLDNEKTAKNECQIDEIIAAGYERAVVERVARLIKINEYKRRQAPVGIRVTHRSFGKDWRYPITSKFNETAGARKP